MFPLYAGQAHDTVRAGKGARGQALRQGKVTMRDDEQGAEVLTYHQGAKAEHAEAKPAKGFVEFVMRDGTRCALPYGQCSVQYFPTENPESIRFKTINDEALMRGHDLAPIYFGLKNRLLAAVRESARCSRGRRRTTQTAEYHGHGCHVDRPACGAALPPRHAAGAS